VNSFFRFHKRPAMETSPDHFESGAFGYFFTRLKRAAYAFLPKTTSATKPANPARSINHLHH
jgi:hypothetical protein